MALQKLSAASFPNLDDRRQADAVNTATNGVESRLVSADGGGEEVGKAPRLPRWTRQEILVLIQGKRVAESRLRRGRAAGMAFGSAQVEPKWASVSSYCKRHGVNRGPVQCRKRWSNLAGDFKKIKEWESRIKEDRESYWVMRNDLRRERKLPGFFDKEVFDILDGGSQLLASAAASPGLALALAPTPTTVVDDVEAIFDSGRSATAEDGLFSDFEQDEGDGSAEREEPSPVAANPVSSHVNLSDKHYNQEASRPSPFQGAASEKHHTAIPEVGSSQDGRKRKRFAAEGDEEMSSLQYHLIDVLERNGKMLTAQLEAQNTNFQLDREQRRNNADGLVAVLNKLADALGKIADKL